MSQWTKSRLEQLITDQVEESLSLDYKRAASLDKTDGKTVLEITKDVSAFANSAGGVLIYGVAEPADRASRHIPERLDPLRRADVSKEWVEQIIQTIQPRIDGVVIHPVIIDTQADTVCYVVEVPQSNTAHQARDHRYYKRHNFSSLPMEDYEVRDTLNRKSQPKVRAAIYVNKNPDRLNSEGLVLVKIENVGRVLIHHLMVEVDLPVNMGGLIMVDKPVLSKDTAEGNCYSFRLIPDRGQTPIFPDSYIILRRKIRTHVREVLDNEGKPVISSRHLKVSVFADEMEPIRTKLEVEPVILGWASVHNPEKKQVFECT